MFFKKPIALIILVCLLLGACSSTKLAYGFLDWLMGWHIGKYVSLNAEQDKFTKTAIDDFHHWHRRTQLPAYADYIKGLKLRLTRGKVTGEQIHAETDQIQIFLDHSIEELIPTLVQLASSLSNEQTKELQKNLKKERDEYKKKYLDVSDEKKYELRKKELRKHLTRLLGPLNSTQKNGLDSWAKSLTPYEELTFKQQQTWAAQADQAMKVRDNKAELAVQVRALMFYHAENWGEEAESAIDRNQDLTYEFIASAFNEMNQKQKSHLEKTLDAYISDFETLAKAE